MSREKLHNGLIILFRNIANAMGWRESTARAFCAVEANYFEMIPHPLGAFPGGHHLVPFGYSMSEMSTAELKSFAIGILPVIQEEILPGLIEEQKEIIRAQMSRVISDATED